MLGPMGSYLQGSYRGMYAIIPEKNRQARPSQATCPDDSPGMGSRRDMSRHPLLLTLPVLFHGTDMSRILRPQAESSAQSSAQSRAALRVAHHTASCSPASEQVHVILMPWLRVHPCRSIGSTTHQCPPATLPNCLHKAAKCRHDRRSHPSRQLRVNALNAGPLTTCCSLALAIALVLPALLVPIHIHIVESHAVYA